MIRLGLLSHLYPFPEPFDLSALSQLPPEKNPRWRGFCAATGFPITALPVERSLRRGVEHPESELIPTLALRPADLMALGLRGPAISAAQKKLALHVLDHPEDNTREKLLPILCCPTGGLAPFLSSDATSSGIKKCGQHSGCPHFLFMAPSAFQTGSRWTPPKPEPNHKAQYR